MICTSSASASPVGAVGVEAPSRGDSGDKRWPSAARSQLQLRLTVPLLREALV
jgi:hypothetical protein